MPDNSTRSHRRRLRRGLPVVLHRQAPPGKGAGAAARTRGRGALPALFSQRLDSARRHFARAISDHQVRLARALQGHRPARRRRGRGGRPRLCLRQDEAPAQYARLPPADPLGGGDRQGGRDEAEADGPLFHARRRPHRPRDAGESRRRCRARRRRSDARIWPATRTSPRSSSEAQSAKEAGIEGVPCFIFGGKFAVSGAQSPEYLAEAIERMAQGQAAAE